MRTRRKAITVDSIPFDSSGPTAVPVERLFAWVIWQFPRARSDGFSGAVHPPEPGHGWYPAIINVENGHVIVFGHVKERFPSPEAASRHLDRAGD
jgi:hypothetical protein